MGMIQGVWHWTLQLGILHVSLKAFDLTIPLSQNAGFGADLKSVEGLRGWFFFLRSGFGGVGKSWFVTFVKVPQLAETTISYAVCLYLTPF